MYYKIISKISKPLSPEILHKLFLFSLKLRIFKKEKNFSNLRTEVFGKSFENPLGLAVVLIKMQMQFLVYLI